MGSDSEAAPAPTANASTTSSLSKKDSNEFNLDDAAKEHDDQLDKLMNEIRNISDGIPLSNNSTPARKSKPSDVATPVVSSPSPPSTIDGDEATPAGSNFSFTSTSVATSAAPKFSPAAPKFSPAAPKFSPAAPTFSPAAAKFSFAPPPPIAENKAISTAPKFSFGPLPIAEDGNKPVAQAGPKFSFGPPPRDNTAKVVRSTSDSNKTHDLQANKHKSPTKRRHSPSITAGEGFTFTPPNPNAHFSNGFSFGSSDSSPKFGKGFPFGASPAPAPASLPAPTPPPAPVSSTPTAFAKNSDKIPKDGGSATPKFSFSFAPPSATFSFGQSSETTPSASNKQSGSAKKSQSASAKKSQSSAKKNQSGGAKKNQSGGAKKNQSGANSKLIASSQSTKRPKTVIPAFETDRQRELIDLLRSHGVDKHVELPQIAVMGDTSSGKSSVLTALSGIQFPSSDKLCTRCPTQLQLKQGDTFRASVHIQRYGGSRNVVAKKQNLSDLDEVTETIKEMTRIITEDLPDGTISEDAIVIKAEGPNLPNLTLIDLPGIVRTVGDGEDASIIPRIQALVERYLEQERTIILAVVPANVDMHNTEILQAAKEADPEGHRTISVLTKLDLVDKGAEESVIELLENRMKKLTLGYHAVRCRGQHDLNSGVSIEDGIEKESEYFETHNDWSRVDKALVGTMNLKEKLSHLLEGHIERSLPLVQKEVRSELGRCRAELEEMGPPLDTSTERRSLCEKSLRALEQSLSSAVKGTYTGSFFYRHLEHIDSGKQEGRKYDPRLRSVISSFEREFRDSIAETRVACYGNIRKDDKVMWHANGQEADPEGVEATVVSDVDDSDGSFFVEPNIIYTHKLRDGDKGEVGEIIDCVNLQLRLTQKIDDTKWKCVQRIHVAGSKMAKVSFPTKEMESLLSENRGEQLSIFPNYTVFTRLVSSFCGKWQTPTEDLSLKTKEEVEMFLKEAINFHLPPYPLFRSMIEMFLLEFVDKRLKDMEKDMMAEMTLEKDYPSTLNHYLYETLIKYRTKPLIQTLKGMSDEDGKISVDHTISVLKNFGVGLKSNEKQEAIDMQFALAAYMKVAQKRFIDTIPRIIQKALMRPVSDDMISAISLTDDELEDVLVETAATKRRRQYLIEKRDSLENAEKAFPSFRSRKV